MSYGLLKELVSKLPSTNPRAVAKAVRRVVDGRRDLIDIGCCGGAIGKHLIKLGYEVTGLDWDPLYLNAALKKGYTHVIRADLTKPLPIRDNTYPIVVASEVIEHMPNKYLEKMVSELYRICDDCLIATVPNCNNPVERFLHKYVFESYVKHLDMGKHYQQFTKESFEELLENAGFSVSPAKLVLMGADILVTAEK